MWQSRLKSDCGGRCVGDGKEGRWTDCIKHTLRERERKDYRVKRQRAAWTPHKSGEIFR